MNSLVTIELFQVLALDREEGTIKVKMAGS